MTRLLKTILSTLIIVILLIGLVFNFNFLEEVELNLHDTYIVINPIIIGAVAFIYLLFLVFLVNGIRNRMNSKEILWPLAITNFLVLTSLLYFMYVSYAMLALSHLDFINPPDPKFEQQRIVLFIVWGIPIVGSAVLEFFLVRKIIKGRVQ